MALYYLPVLVRSDRYFVTRLENTSDGIISASNPEALIDFNFVVHAGDRVLAPMLTIEDPGKIVLNQLAPTGDQDIPLSECHLSLSRTGKGFELLIRKDTSFAVEPFHDTETGLRLDYAEDTRRVVIGYYRNQVQQTAFDLSVTLLMENGERFSGIFRFNIVRAVQCQRVVIDFGSEASQIGYRNCGPQSGIVPYDILQNIMSQLNMNHKVPAWRRDDFLNHEPDQHMLYRSFYAVKKKITNQQRKTFPFNFNSNIEEDEIRLFITRHEVSATQFAFRDDYEIIPNLKLGIEKSLQLQLGDRTEDYSIRVHKKELISAVLLRLLRLMISTKPDFRQGGLIVTLLVPNIYTQHDVFELLNELRMRTGALLDSLSVPSGELSIEYETISESDAAFMGYQQTHSADVSLSNGEIALVIDCGKGTTDISMVLADDNENYSSFFRTGFAGAGNVLLYGFVEDFLTLVLKAIPGSNSISVRDFINRHIRDQNLTADVLNFIQLMEDHKKRFRQLEPVGIGEFSQIAEQSESTERTIASLHKDQSMLLQYAEAILKDRSIRWDEEVTGLIQKATDCIACCIVDSIRDVITKDIRRRIKTVMLSGRAFYFEDLRVKLEKELQLLLGSAIKVSTVPSGRAINNKNVAIYGAFTGAYKITDFTGIPIDKKEGLSRNSDVLNNNMFLYRGIKIQPGNDILYNGSVARRNNMGLKDFKNKTVDIYFTRDNIYLRLLENQRVKIVRSLYSVLSADAGPASPLQDMKVISMFPGYTGELVSVDTIYRSVTKDRTPVKVPAGNRRGILQFFNF